MEMSAEPSFTSVLVICGPYVSVAVFYDRAKVENCENNHAMMPQNDSTSADEEDFFHVNSCVYEFPIYKEYVERRQNATLMQE